MSTCYGSRFPCSANRFELLQPMLRDRAVNICASKSFSRSPGLLTVLAMALRQGELGLVVGWDRLPSRLTPLSPSLPPAERPCYTGGQCLTRSVSWIKTSFCTMKTPISIFANNGPVESALTFIPQLRLMWPTRQLSDSATCASNITRGILSSFGSKICWRAS